MAFLYLHSSNYRLPFPPTSINPPILSYAPSATESESESSFSFFRCFFLGLLHMDRFVPLLSLLLLSAAASHAAALPSQVYWDTVLPKTPMPSVIRELLRPDEKARTSVSVRKGGVNVNTGKGEPGGTNVNVGRKEIRESARGVFGQYLHAVTETQVHNDPRVSLYFFEKDLHPGAKMRLRFTSLTPGAAFLPRQAADSIPFSTKNLSEILDHFSIESNSVEAEAMKQTLHDCEEPAAEGERKYCATSLESMVDFSISSLGTRDVCSLSTTMGKDGEREQQYTVKPSGVRRLAGSELVACHSESYAYAVFYCHAKRSTRGYTVEMVGENGAAVEAVAMCHADTAGWNPESLALKVLKVRPGAVPVCHFLLQDGILWAPSK